APRARGSASAGACRRCNRRRRAKSVVERSSRFRSSAWHRWQPARTGTATAARYRARVSPNPIEEAADALRALGERVRQTVGNDLAARLGGPRREPEPKPLDELQAELDALVGLDSVKEQVRALIAFLQVQSRRQEHGLSEVATSQHLVFLGNP